MANDFALQAREYLVEALRADAALTALLPAERIYGELVPAKPTWPFIRVEPPISAPDRATCLDGSTEQFAIHCFTKGGSADACFIIRGAIIKALDGVCERINAGANRIDIIYNGAQMLRDTAEAEAWHGIANFQVDFGG